MTRLEFDEVLLMRKLTAAQGRAYLKLRGTRGWDTPYDLRATIPTLEVLVRLGYADRRAGSVLGGLLTPRTSIEYRYKEQGADDQVEGEGG